jgi:EAL domain-containing protein (putative c-di-GMP-specific phosphodiesterase class I)
MSINLSARQLETDETVDELLAIADRIAVPREMIVLELTESVLIEDLADKARLTRLQAEGFRLAVDDFGTGYSGLAYLQNLPFDIIKVDRAFVTGVDTNVNRATFLESILELAKGVGATTLGEGIEGAGELDLLRKLGFDFGQGYYFSRPVPSETFATMIGLEQLTA